MHIKIKKHLKKYLNFLDSQPDTRCNRQLIDCVNQILNVAPDTGESLDV